MQRRHSLRQQLLGFSPADAAEAAHRDRMLALLDAQGDPFSRAHFVPGHFTASGFVLNSTGDALLLIFHGKLHRWLQPGGHIDPADADLVSAARREVKEETGLDVDASANQAPFDLDIHPIPVNPGRSEPAHEHFDVRFVFVATGAGLVAASDAMAAQWLPLEQVTEALTDASVMRAVRKLKSRAMDVCETGRVDPFPARH
jgi:8-oxo-dGTP pyrophosphatase MutT (NUDIX family)